MRKIAVLLASFALAACAANSHEDLRQWMSEVSKDVKGKIPPLPEVKPYEPVLYDAANLLDPFKSNKIEPEQKKNGGGGLQPDYDRAKEPLESYPLESLKYVAVLIKNKVGYAIIQADGALFQVKVGNYMGQNFGLITQVSESEVTLRELAQDSTGDWVERESSLLLQEKESRK